MMRDCHMIATAKEVGWNTEHEVTNKMLVKFGRKLLSDVQEQLKEQAIHIQDNNPEGAEAVRDCISLFDSWGE